MKAADMRHSITRLHGPRRAGGAGSNKAAMSSPERAGLVIRRFFDLIGRFERHPERLEMKSAPPRRLRISCFDGSADRQP